MELDYKKLGLKCGLEIHQQLDTHKLFCNCQSVLRKDEPDFEIKRKLHVVAGESGEIDIAVKHEMEKDREIIYQGYDTTCLVELDEEPPHLINQEALKIALQISFLLNCKIIPITQIMRKTVIDGSNTSGFQRTIMIAREGYVETEFGRVEIQGVFLEEDSARAVTKEGGLSVYKIDRLGIPLIEIATAPDIKTPEQAKETALHIGSLLRNCAVKRGLGTIRQDINISINKSNRVELKGFQDPKIMIETVKNEVLRQLEFVENNKKNPSEVRNVLVDGKSEFLRPMPGEARMYPETDLPLLKISREFINKVKKTLPRLRQDFEKELSEKGLNREMIKLLLNENKIEEFKELLKVLNKPALVAKLILIFPKEISAHKKIPLIKVENILEENYFELLELVAKNKLSENNLKDVLEKIVDGKTLGEAVSFEKLDYSKIDEKIIHLMKEKPGLSEQAYMGLIMKEFKGVIEGKEAIERIRKYLGK